MPGISKQLLQLRKKLGLSQRQLADKVGINQTMISDYEINKFSPTQETIKKFAKQGIIIDLKANQIIYNEKEMKEGKVRLTFNIENETFDLCYSSHKEENTLKNTSHTRTYNLVIDNEFDKLLEFFAVKYPAQIKNIQIQNIKEASLSVTSTKTEYLYLLTNRGDTVGMVKFKPSKFEDIFEEAKELTIEDKKEEEVEKEIHTQLENAPRLYIYFNNNSDYFILAYEKNSYHYSERKDSSTYRLLLDGWFTGFIKAYLKKENSYQNIEKDITDAYLDIYFKTNCFTLIIYGDGFYEKIALPVTDLVDSDETHKLPIFLKEKMTLEDKPNIPIPKLLQIDLPKIDSTMERDVVIFYKKLIQTRDQYDFTLEQIKRLVVDKVTKNTPQVKEYICKVYKQEIENEKYLEIGTVNDKDEVTFYLPKQSEDSFQGKWHSYYSKVFIKQTTWIYEDGTEELGTGYEFTPTNKIQEIESSDRKGVIGYVEHKAGIVEVIYYDRFVN